MKITIFKLIEKIMSLKGASFVSFKSKTVPKLRKGNPWGGLVEKTSVVNGVIGYHYDKAVNRQRVREGDKADFVAAPRRWGKWLVWLGKETSYFVTHENKFYLRIKIERVLTKPVYEDKNGLVISNEAITPWLYSSSPSRQGLDNEIIHREYNLSNIESITFNKRSYQLVS